MSSLVFYFYEHTFRARASNEIQFTIMSHGLVNLAWRVKRKLRSVGRRHAKRWLTKRGSNISESRGSSASRFQERESRFLNTSSIYIHTHTTIRKTTFNVPVRLTYFFLSFYLALIVLFLFICVFTYFLQRISFPLLKSAISPVIIHRRTRPYLAHFCAKCTNTAENEELVLKRASSPSSHAYFVLLLLLLLTLRYASQSYFGEVGYITYLVCRASAKNR